MRIIYLVLMMCFVNICIWGCGAHDAHHEYSATRTNQNTDSAASLPAIHGSSEYRVIEPVSNGEVFIYETGKFHTESILLIHGAGDEGALVWSGVIPQLAERYHVVTFDLPGFGRSGKQNILYSPLFYAKFIKWVVGRYAMKRPLIIMGHSLGGAVALCYAATHPENLRRLILIDVSGIVHRVPFSQHIMENIPEKHKGWRKIPFKLFGEIMKNALGAAEVPERSDDIDNILKSPDRRRQFLNADSQRIAGLALANFDFSELIYRIKIPAVIIWGANDTITSVRTGKLLAHILPKSQLNIIPDTGHNIIREKPKYFNQLIKDALITTAWQAQWQPPPKIQRSARLSHKENMRLTGYYSNIEISHCGNILIKDVETEYIEVNSSDKVVIENCRINGKTVALKTRGSRIELTNVTLTADTAVIVKGCILDLAGVELTGHKAAVTALGGSELFFSISKIDSPFNTGYIHGHYEVIPKRPL